MPYDHLLVPIDWNDSDQRALEAAIELAAQHQATTTLIYVIEAIDDDGDDLQLFYAELEQSIRARLQKLIQKFQQAGLEARQEIVVGQKTRTIVQYTATESIDLVVLPTERVDLRQPNEAINTSGYQISVLCQCPVMLIK